MVRLAAKPNHQPSHKIANSTVTDPGKNRIADLPKKPRGYDGHMGYGICRNNPQAPGLWRL